MNNSFENKYRFNNICFRYAKGKTLREGNEIHPYHEILYFIKGGGRCFTEQFDTDLQEHMLFIIPKNTYHQFAIEDQENYTRLTITFEDGNEWSDIALLSEKLVGVVKATEAPLHFLLTKLCTALAANEITPQTDRLIYGSFLLLLSEISNSKSEVFSPERNGDRALISSCTAYIDENFSTDISVDRLASLMKVSSATLFWHFKKYLGISVHKYILQKRMAHAHMLLSQGQLPTKIYHDCGYHDYATFYKAYCKHFGYPPSETSS